MMTENTVTNEELQNVARILIEYDLISVVQDMFHDRQYDEQTRQAALVDGTLLQLFADAQRSTEGARQALQGGEGE